MRSLNNFRELASYSRPADVKRLWWVTLFRIVSSGLDILALVVIWYTVNSVVTGSFTEISIAGITVIQAQALDEITVALFGAGTLILFVFKSVFGIYTLKSLRDVGVEIEATIARRVLEKLISGQSGGAHSGRETQPKVQHALVSARAWVAGSGTSFSVFLSETALIIALFAVMAMSSPISAVGLVVILGGTGAILQRFLSRAVEKQARIQKKSSFGWMSDVTSAVSIRTHLSLKGLDDEWVDGLSEKIKESSKAAGNSFFLNAVPRYVLEFAVLVIVALVIGGSFLLGDFADNAPGAAVILAGAFRISGALGPLLTSLNRMGHGRVMGQSVRELLREAPEVFELESGLLEEITSLIHSDSKFLVISGPSGIGKTTSLLSSLATIKVDPRFQSLSLGYGGQDPAIVTGGISRNIGLKYSEKGFELDKKIQELGDQLGMEGLIARLSVMNESDRKSITLSGGEITRMEILRAHSSWPDVIFLDEPTTGLDKRARMNLATFVNKNKAKYVLVTHDEQFVSQLDNPMVVDFETKNSTPK